MPEPSVPLDPAPRTFGGFIGIEPFLPEARIRYPDALAFSSGRACLAALLRRCPHVRRVHIPFHTCDAALIAFREAGIEIVFHGIDHHLQPREIPVPQRDELLVLIDLFGVSGERTTSLGASHGDRVVYDDTHAFHAGRRAPTQWSFNSARKFCGVPDGGFLFAPVPMEHPREPRPGASCEHLVLGSLGEQDAAYARFLVSEEGMTTAPYRISAVSERLLARYDHDRSILRRQRNFQRLHERLGAANDLVLRPDERAVPLCYPFLPKNGASFDRASAASRGVFLPLFWKDVLRRSDPANSFGAERDLASRMIALPIDQRYSVDDMDLLLARLRDAWGDRWPEAGE